MWRTASPPPTCLCDQQSISWCWLWMVILDMETLDFSQTEFSSRLLQIPQEKSQEILFNNFCWRIVIVNVLNVSFSQVQTPQRDIRCILVPWHCPALGCDAGWCWVKMCLSCPCDQQWEVPRVQSRYQASPPPPPGHLALSRYRVFLRIWAGLTQHSSFHHCQRCVLWPLISC